MLLGVLLWIVRVLFKNYMCIVRDYGAFWIIGAPLGKTHGRSWSVREKGSMMDSIRDTCIEGRH